MFFTARPTVTWLARPSGVLKKASPPKTTFPFSSFLLEEEEPSTLMVPTSSFIARSDTRRVSATRALDPFSEKSVIVPCTANRAFLGCSVPSPFFPCNRSCPFFSSSLTVLSASFWSTTRIVSDSSRPSETSRAMPRLKFQSLEKPERSSKSATTTTGFMTRRATSADPRREPPADPVRQPQRERARMVETRKYSEYLLMEAC